MAVQGKECMRGWTPPWQRLAGGSYFFFSRRSFSAWVPSLVGTMGSCRPSSESISRTRREEMAYQRGPLCFSSLGLGRDRGAGQQEAPQHVTTRGSDGTTHYSWSLHMTSLQPGSPTVLSSGSLQAQRAFPWEPQPWRCFSARRMEVVPP